MSNIYESIVIGLTEAINDVKSNEKMLKRNIVDEEFEKEYNVEEVKKDNN